jgi:glycosyltransferase involved in cell wall biosynthesis
MVTGVNLTPTRFTAKALSYLSLATGYGWEYNRTRLASAFHGLWMREHIGQGRKVFVHTGTNTIPLNSRVSSVRHVLFFDSTFHLMSASPSAQYSNVLRRRYDEFERAAITAAHHVFTVSESARADVIHHYGCSAERVTAVGTGTGNIRPRGGKKDYSRCNILFVAKERFEEKGGLVLLDGFRIAQKVDRRLKLTVVATEQYRQLIEQVPGATFKTALPWEELEACYNDASLFAMPALYEPWGLVFLEALACRTPVLGTNRNALPELTQNGQFGFLISEANPSSVATELINAFSDMERLAKMGSAGQEYVQGRYSWDKAAWKICAALLLREDSGLQSAGIEQTCMEVKPAT